MLPFVALDIPAPTQVHLLQATWCEVNIAAAFAADAVFPRQWRFNDISYLKEIYMHKQNIWLGVHGRKPRNVLSSKGSIYE